MVDLSRSRVGAGDGVWQCTPEVRIDVGAVVSNESQTQTQALEDLGDAPNYQAWLASMAQPYLGSQPLELGSGLGDYARIWLDDGTPTIRLTEADGSRLEFLRRRFAHDSRVTVSTFDAALSSGTQYSCLVSFNVLEHVERPVELLVHARKSLQPGAYLLAFVPAFPFAMSDFDRSIGHYRRYTRTVMSEHLQHAGYEVVDVRYVNAPGLLAWFVGMRLLRLTPGTGPFLKLWDQFVIPPVRWFESRWRVPFGQSVWAVAKVPS